MLLSLDRLLAASIVLKLWASQLCLFSCPFTGLSRLVDCDCSLVNIALVVSDTIVSWEMVVEI